MVLEASRWGVPAPYQVLTFLFLVAEACKVSGTLDGTPYAPVLEVLVTFFALLGIATARNFVSPQILAKLEAFDLQHKKD
jgi:hypothetical protein